MWAAAVFAFARNAAPTDALFNSPIAATVIFALLSGLFVLLTLPSALESVAQMAHQALLPTVILPLLLLLLYVIAARQSATFELGDVLIAGALLFLPIALAALNEPALRWSELSMGILTVLAPLALPFTRLQQPEVPMFGLRAAALALPVILALLSTRAQKSRLNFLSICAITAVWYTLLFNTLPIFNIARPFALSSLLVEPAAYFQLALLVAMMWSIAIAHKFRGMGLQLHNGISWAHTGLMLLNLALFIGVALVAAWWVGSLRFDANRTVGGMILMLPFFFVFAALPSEIIFRGVFLRYFQDALRFPTWLSIALAAILFALPYVQFAFTDSIIAINMAGGMLSQFASSWVAQFALTALLGIVYGQIYASTRSVMAAALAHAAVLWLRWIITNA